MQELWIAPSGRWSSTIWYMNRLSVSDQHVLRTHSRLHPLLDCLINCLHPYHTLVSGLHCTLQAYTHQHDAVHDIRYWYGWFLVRTSISVCRMGPTHGARGRARESTGWRRRRVHYVVWQGAAGVYWRSGLGSYRILSTHHRGHTGKDYGSNHRGGADGNVLQQRAGLAILRHSHSHSTVLEATHRSRLLALPGHCPTGPGRQSTVVVPTNGALPPQTG